MEAADALKLTATDLIRLGVVDEIVPEPAGGAHTDLGAAAALLNGPLSAALAGVSAPDAETRLNLRYAKFRQMGSVGLA